MYSWNRPGFRWLPLEDFSKVIVEIYTSYLGLYGRFIVLVVAGVGCTVWYTFSPTLEVPAASMVEGFPPFASYESFFCGEHIEPGLNKISLTESSETLSSAEAALRDDNNPFRGVPIPASGPALQAVGLGLMVGVLLSAELSKEILKSIVTS